jgi:histidine triad (HIT) family protein
MTVFDHIIQGTIPASFVHRDDRCVAFMDIKPMSPGHVLVVPLQSVATLEEIEPQARAHLWDVAIRIGAAQRQGLGSLAQHFLVNDGRAASQSVPHVHIHVIPRYANDGVRTVGRMAWHLATLQALPRESSKRRAGLERAARAIRSALQ